eukprot:gene26394-17488_t
MNAHMRSSALGSRMAVKQTALHRLPQQRTKSSVCRAQTVADLPAPLQKIVGAFQMVPDPMARYKQLLYFATKLDVLPKEDQIPENKVEGCVSQVWVKPELRDDGKLYWKAESDSQLTKGLAALLAQGLSGTSPEEVLRIEPDFIEMLGLKQSLTPSRSNGFLNMFKLMQRKAAAAAVTAMQAEEAGLVIEDESSKHAGHAAMMVAPGKPATKGETHFKVVVVSEQFDGLNLVKRHRLIYSILQEEFSRGLHALSLDTKTPAEAQS